MFDAVWYQVFPERFRNGDPGNDPAPAALEAAAPGWRPRGWTTDWHRRSDWERRLGPDPRCSLAHRRYGGDLQGVIDKLDYLHDLGVNALYLNPVFDSPSAHKYNARGYVHVDPDFGPDPEGDRKAVARAGETHKPGTWIWTRADKLLLELVARARGLGMRVILDGVFNHIGSCSPFYRDVMVRGPASEYFDWFWAAPPPAGPRRPRTAAMRTGFKCWWGIDSLPEWGRAGSGLRPGPEEYILACLQRWLAPGGDPDAGVHGFRLDVFNELPPGFRLRLAERVKAVNPEAALIGEVWTDPAAYFREGSLDGVSHYLWTRTAARVFVDRENRAPLDLLRRVESRMAERYPAPNRLAGFNPVSSHDTDRVLSQLANPDRPFNSGNEPFGNPEYFRGRPGPEARRRLEPLLVWQFTAPGAPMVYYGDEAGMWGARDPECRKPMIWDDLGAYEPEQLGGLSFEVAPDPQIAALYRELIRLRRRLTPLRRGGLRFLDAGGHVLALVREYGGESVLALINRESEAREFSVELDHGPGAGVEAVFGDAAGMRLDRGQAAGRLNPQSGLVLQIGGRA